MHPLPPTLAVTLLLFMARHSPAQSTKMTLDDKGQWQATQEANPDPDLAVLNETRRLLAAEKFLAAQNMADDWIDRQETGNSKNPYLPEAYLLRGNAQLARGNEYDALVDYETIINGYPGSEVFPLALEREFDIAVMYLNGLKEKIFGIRLQSAVPRAEEIIIRVYERLPGSPLAERALLELADYYYRTRDLRGAAEAYDLFLTLFPKSDKRSKAMQRRVFANIAQFKGPKHDPSGLVEAKYQIEAFQREFPGEAESSGMSDALVARLDESAAAQRLATATWYIKRADPEAAKLTLTRLIRRHPRTAAAQEAVNIMTDRGWFTAPQSAADGSPRAEPQR